MSEEVSMTTHINRVYIAVNQVPGPDRGRLVELGVYRIEQYSNGLVRELPPQAVPIDQIGSVLHDDDLPILFGIIVNEFVAREIPLPELP